MDFPTAGVSVAQRSIHDRLRVANVHRDDRKRCALHECMGREGGVSGFAGLSERWTVPVGLEPTGSLAELREDEVLETCAILTMCAYADVARVHDRMPTILPPAAFDSWLPGGDVALDPGLEVVDRRSDFTQAANCGNHRVDLRAKCQQA